METTLESLEFGAIAQDLGDLLSLTSGGEGLTLTITPVKSPDQAPLLMVEPGVTDSTAIAAVETATTLIPSPSATESLDVVALVATSITVGVVGGLQFTFNAAPGTPQTVIDGFVNAGHRWSSVFSDSITIEVDIAYEPLGPNVLGATGSTQYTFPYATVRDGLVADATSPFDAAAIATLPGGNSFPMVINNTQENNGSATPYLDNNGSANNTTITLTAANIKALGGDGLIPDVADADITFSSQFPWDFDRSNGIAAGTYDFEGVATHEIGHALGFVSEVDTLDLIAGLPLLDRVTSENLYAPTTLDLFRYSVASANAGAIDFSADGRDKFFSLDGGATKIASFSQGSFVGDGNQASHWKDNLNIGLMDPTISAGEFGDITRFDALAFDVIGWDLAAIA